MIGDHIFVNCQVDEKEPKSGGSPPTLKEEETKFCVAEIVQIRGTLIRVVWYYSPDDLHGRRRPYHGKYEIVRSTWEDIIPVEAVAGLLEVVHWDENDDIQRCLDVLFWRQTCDGNGMKLDIIP